jgi:hypothetical protein
MPLQVFFRHRMFQKTSDVFLDKERAICSRRISSNKWISRHRMFHKHPMSFWTRRGLFVPDAFHRTSGFPDIGCFTNIRCLLARRTLFVPDAFHRTRGFQTSDVSKTSDVFWQGERCLFQTHFIEQGDSRHRMFYKHPMSFRNESS